MPRPGYKASNIPPELAKQVDDARGEDSFDGFVHKALREKLERLGKRKK